MSTRYAIASSLFGVLMLALGIWIGWGAAVSEEAGKLSGANERFQEERVALKKRLVTLALELSAVRTTGREAEERGEALSREVASLTAELGTLQKEAEQTAQEQDATEGRKSPVSFGKYADLEAFREANWPEIAEAVDRMSELMVGLVETIEAGEEPDAEVQDKIREENNKLVRFAAELLGKIPSNSPINGEFTHPLSLANLMGAMLDRYEMPLSEQQLSEIAAFGEDYEQRYDEVQAGYTGETGRLEKLIDELELKRDTMDGMYALLTDDQRVSIVRPEIQHRLQIDVLSPFTMAVMLTRPRNKKSVGEVRELFTDHASKKFGLSPETHGALESIADAWMQDLQPLLSPADKAHRFVHIDQAITAGRAQANAINRLLQLPDLDEKTRKALLNEMSWAVPGVVLPEAP